LPDWLVWIAVVGTVTAGSSRIFIETRTRLPGHRTSSAFSMVARTVAMPVAGSTVFSIMVTWP